MGFDERGKRGIRTGRTVRSAHCKREGKSFRGRHREGVLQVKSIRKYQDVEAVLSANEEFLSGVVYSLGKRRRWNAAAEMRTAQQQEASDEEVVVVERVFRPNSKHTRSAYCLSVSDGHGRIVRSDKKFGARVDDLLKCVEVGDCEVSCDVFYPPPKGSWLDCSPSSCSSKRTKNTSYSRRKKNYNWDIDYEEEDFEVEEQDFEQGQTSEQGCPVSFDIGAYIDNMIRKPDMCKVHGRTKRTDAVFDCGRVSRKHSGAVQESSDRNHIIIADDESVQKWMQIRGDGKSRSKLSNMTTVTPAIPVPSTEAIQSSQTVDLVNIDKRELEPCFLRHQFQENYREALSIPRTFEIKITQLPPGYEDDFSFSLIFHIENLLSSKTNLEKVSANIVAITHTDLDNSADVQSVFAKSLQKCLQDHHTSTVYELVGLATGAVCKVLSSVGSPKPRYSNLHAPKYSTALLGAMCGWKTSAFVTSEAQKDVKKDITAQESAVTSDAVEKDSPGFSGYLKSSPDSCGICFADLSKNGITDLGLPQCTAMKECCHWFCNECWQMHIHTQSTDGQTQITCPEYECNTVVDSITVMSLIPSWYGKHTSRVVGRKLESSPVWRWCPYDRCSLAVKALPHPSSFDGNNRPGSMPVVCGCGNIWCFSCQGKAHWPASCQQAKHFRKEYSRFLKLQDAKKLITSVRVKQCPNCGYPIEKSQGCSHMYCIMCKTNFCWSCLSTYTHEFGQCRCYRYGYGDQVGRDTFKDYTRVNLKLQPDLLPEQFPFVYIVRNNLNATSRKFLTKNFKRLEWLERSMQKISSKKAVGVDGRVNGISKAAGFVDFLATNDLPKYLKAVYNVKFEAQLVLEGTAIFIGCYKKKAKPGNLVFNLLRLQFIVDRLEELLSNHSKLVKKGNLPKLSSFTAEAKRTISLIGRQMCALYTQE